MLSMRRVFAAALAFAAWCCVGLGAEIGGQTYSANTTFSNGDTWGAGAVVINAGITCNVPNAATVSFTSGLNNFLRGTGVLRIDSGGTWQHTIGSEMQQEGANTILNNGTFEFTSTGKVKPEAAGAEFVNNGLLKKSGTGTAAVADQFSYNNGRLLSTGDVEVAAGATLWIRNGSGVGYLRNATYSGGGTVTVDGYWSEISGTIQDGTAIQNYSTVHVPAGGSLLVDIGGQLLLWTGGTSMMFLNGGTVTNASGTTIWFETPGGNSRITGPGAFVNEGTFVYNDTVDMQMAQVEFANYGTYHCIGAGHAVQFNSVASGSFTNYGTLLKTGGGKSEILSNSRPVDFRDGCSVTVTNGELELRSVDVRYNGAVPGNTLNFNLTLIDPDGVGAGYARLDAEDTTDIYTIGANGSLTLSGGAHTYFSTYDNSGNNIDNIATVNGTLALVDGHDHLVTPNGGTFTAPGVLKFGLNGVADPVPTLDVTGALDITGTEFAIQDEGGLEPGTYTLITYSGALSSGGMTVTGLGNKFSGRIIAGGGVVQLKLSRVGTIIFIR